MSKRQAIARFYQNASNLGLSMDEADALRRIEMTLHRWAEMECGNEAGHIERDEKTGKPSLVRHLSSIHSERTHSTPIPDREKGALTRLARILARHPRLVAYHQGDPRGCALYVLRREDVEGKDINAHYSKGWAVCH